MLARPTRTIRTALILAVMLATAAAAAPPARAADKAPWAQASEEFAADLLVRHDSASGDTLSTVAFSWWHYATPNTGIGAQLSGLFGPADGALVGPSFVHNFLYFGCDSAGAGCKGNIEVGGAATMTTGDLTDLAAAQAATWIGPRFFVGQSSAAHLLAQYTRAIEPGDAGGDGVNSLDSFSLLFRFSVGVKQPPAS